MRTGGTPTPVSMEKKLANWAATNNLLTLYDPKQPTSFISGRWQLGTNPDLTFSTQIYGTTPERYILERFPKSRHRPSLITTPPLISFTSSASFPDGTSEKQIGNFLLKNLKKL